VPPLVPPVVDDADVARMIDFMFGKGFNATISPEERADSAYRVALHVAMLQGLTKSYAEALAQRVRDRVLWLKGPTGGPVKWPE
jgi:hypothetical protein